MRLQGNRILLGQRQGGMEESGAVGAEKREGEEEDWGEREANTREVQESQSLPPVELAGNPLSP